MPEAKQPEKNVARRSGTDIWSPPDHGSGAAQPSDIGAAAYPPTNLRVAETLQICRCSAICWFPALSFETPSAADEGMLS